MSNSAEILLKVYGKASMPRIVHALGTEITDADAAYEALETMFSDKKARQKVIKALDKEQRGFLAFADKIGRRLRGERLKKRWFLHGYDNFAAVIQPLVDSGIMVVGNIRAREPVSLDTALDQGITQQWVQLTPGFEGLAGDPPPQREVVEKVVDETTAELVRRTLVVEFNILSVVRYVEGETIRLNRDGSPHRSDLKVLSQFVVDRHSNQNSASPAPDPLTAAGWDVLIFILSLAESLGMIARHDEVVAATNKAREYFVLPLEERLTLLTRAIEQQRMWNEFASTKWANAGEPPATGHGDGAFPEADDLATLSGPRGSVLAALRRLGPVDWFDVTETVRTIAELESQYLRSSLPAAVGGASVNEEFVHAVITSTLTHIGAIELGRSSSGTRRARLTPVGRAMVGIGDYPAEPDGRGAILVEPNFEITCFLDMASARLLFDLSRFSDVVRTGEHVVRSRLHGESVQWGYARGYTADGIVETLTEFSARPLPPAVSFALQDWERLHRRVTVYAYGSLIAAGGPSDPEVVQSGLRFAVEDDDRIEIVNDTHTFVVAETEEDVGRALQAHNPTTIDYTDEIVPTLTWIDDQRVYAPVGATDLRTLSELIRLATEEEPGVFKIAPDKVRSTYGDEDGFRELIALLKVSLIEGTSPEREIGLKRLLGKPADAAISSAVVLRLSSDDDGDRIENIGSLAAFIVDRLGPRAFTVKAGSEKKLAKSLRQLGISVVEK